MEHYKNSHLLPNQSARESRVAFVRTSTVYSKDRRIKLPARRLVTFCLVLLVIQGTDLSTPVLYPFQQGSTNSPEQELLRQTDHRFHLKLSNEVECGAPSHTLVCHLSTYFGGVCSALLYIFWVTG